MIDISDPTTLPHLDENDLKNLIEQKDLEISQWKHAYFMMERERNDLAGMIDDLTIRNNELIDEIDEVETLIGNNEQEIMNSDFYEQGVKKKRQIRKVLSPLVSLSWKQRKTR